jgi:catechol 2,3-dioxygenase-like lactoylglutathione lyase family enzyme
MTPAFDHIGYNVADFPRSVAFYTAALAPLGHAVLGSGEGWAMIGGPGGKLWIGAFGPAPSGVHVAFAAESRAQVDAFHKAALAAGGRDNGAPGPRPNYGPTYYAAFVLDPDGHNIEAVCRAAV